MGHFWICESKQSAKRQRYQEDVEENRAAKRQKYEDNSAAIKASERNRYWNDPALSDWLNVLPRGSGIAWVTELPKVCHGMLYCTSIKKL